MITTFLQGGLGNQLFQWAVAENLALKNNTKINFDISFYLNQNHRKFELYKFKNIEINIAQPEDINKNVNIIKETDLNSFDIQYVNPTYLYGYWQNEFFFKDSETTIRNKLEIQDDLDNYIKNKYPVLGENTVSIHVRRTDYISLSDFHYNQSLDYFKNAYDLLTDNNINVLVFSDDINWCKDNIKFNKTIFIEGEDNITDLYMMSKCQNNIITNSTFSWWGAWINKNKNKIIISPKNWFGINGPKKSDPALEKWIKI